MINTLTAVLYVSLVCNIAISQCSSSPNIELATASVTVTEDVVIEFCKVPGGTVFIGSPPYELGHDKDVEYRREKISGFWISKFEVTTLEYGMFIEADGYDNREHWSKDGYEYIISHEIKHPRFWAENLEKLRGMEGNYPAIGLSYYEAEAYCSWLSGITGKTIVLPSPEQWEYAAEGETRRGESKLFPWGDIGNDGVPLDDDLRLMNTNYDHDPYVFLAPIDAFDAGISWCGAYNMCGNASEFTNSLLEDKSVPSGMCIVKGGSFIVGKGKITSKAQARADVMINHLTVSTRVPCTKSFQHVSTGLRLVMVDE